MIGPSKQIAVGLAIMSMSVISTASACTTNTREQIAEWQNRLAAAHKFRGTYRELSRSTEIERSDDPLNGDIETTKVTGTVIDARGRPRVTVIYIETNDLGLCLWGRNPADGQSGVVFAERSANGNFHAIDFRENRKH